MIGQAFTTALRSIWSKKIRSVLTMLGVIIGVAQIIALIGLGEGVKQSITNEVTQLGSNLLFVLPGKVDSEQGGFNPAASVGASTLTDTDVEIIRAIPEVEIVSPISVIAGVPVAGTRTAQGALIAAVDPDYFKVMKTMKVGTGRVFTDQENTSEAPVLILGARPQQILFPEVASQNVIGKEVTIGKTAFTVIGVLDAQPSTSAFGGNQTESIMYMPYQTGQALNENAQIFRMAVQTTADSDVKAVAKKLRTALKAEHGIEDFTVFTQEDLLKVIDSILGLITTAIVGLASISLIVGGIGIMNIMLVSVTERTKEIGLRKALGATRGNILMQFLTESAVISLIGGAIGVAIAVAAGIVTKAKADLSIVVDLHSILIAVGFSLGVGIIFGLLPAIRAARKDPIEALRYE